ncbi:hypothetical protein [Leptospira sarikeiensis]|uniref:GAF domain-containing protein n=1 Tax=Leptospira sarikeiensis TaxID=2484943 RepID=A0A4V3JRP7_9LEPT|nr:hypothetical protein [Leptospira sarikeiensis]TGL61155.1 hypothetical protein EHQ64_11075 [Leptospira sarikeiensis]
MQKTLGDYISIFISIVGSLASIIAFYVVFKDNLNEQGVYGVIFLGIISIYLLISNAWLIAKYRKKTRYVSVFEELNAGYHKIHQGVRNESLDIVELKTGLETLCTHLTNIFSEINGHRISTCIKIIINENNKPRLITLCRDIYSKTNRVIGNDDITKHWMTENSDFNFIFESISEGKVSNTFFHANWLPVHYEYKNTRLGVSKLSNIPFLSLLLRFFQWPLPYKSTIVVPIIPFSIEGQKDALRGFLCIDSPKNVAFNAQIDVQILNGVSDGIYTVIDKIFESLNKSTKKGK